MTHYSMLDLCPVVEGQGPKDAFRNALELAQLAERQGFRRYWLAEHHNMAGIASAATSILIGHIAAGTERIRVGAGGIMMPNHAPLQIAEQFGTLETLFPGRIDLGVGRAPGTDGATAAALRQHLNTDVNRFPTDVEELLGYFQPERPGQQVRAVPGAGLDVPVWILGSSLYGAGMAAEFGLPYAFAAHFAPADLLAAIALYRRDFKPSIHLAKPYVMAGFNVIAADTDAEAQFLASSMQQAFVRLYTGKPGKFSPPQEGYFQSLPANVQATLNQVLGCSAIGSANTVWQKLNDFLARTQVDEILITGSTFSQTARRHSFEIAGDVLKSLR
jgi:luciferase family oxidoreductase group 1